MADLESSEISADVSGDLEDEVMEWEVRLGDSMSSKRFPVVIVMIVVSFIGFFLLRSPIAGIIGPAVVFASTSELFLPIKYRLSSVDLSQKIGFAKSLIEWKEVQRTAKVKDGIRLMPLKKESRMDAFRGVTVRFSGNETEVLAKIAERLAKHGRSLDGRVDAGGGEGAD